MRLRCAALAASLFLSALNSAALASITVNLDAGRLRESSAVRMNSTVGDGALLLLIASGPDLVFSNSNVTAGQFVTGDDVVLGSGGFNEFTGPDFTATVFMFNLPTAAQPGQRIALRWFARTTLRQFQDGATPAAGDPFGTYNPRMYSANTTDNPDGAEPWLVPGDGATIDLRFFTSDSVGAGSQAPSSGYANFVVQPATAGTPTPTPPPTPTPTASPTPTTSPTPSVPPSPSPSPSATPSPSASPSPTVTPSPSASPSPSPRSHLANISTRLRVGTADNVLIAGFILQGTGEKRLIVRGIGPSLRDLPGKLIDPVLELYDNQGTPVDANDNWQENGNKGEIEESTLAPTHPNEPALLRRLPVAAADAAYTAIVSGKNGTTGIGLVELYDLDQNGPVQIVNIATRGFVRTDDDAMIGGLIVTGEVEAEVVIRAVGPSLGEAVDNKLADPVLGLFNDDGEAIFANDDWKANQQEAIESSGLAPQDENESAIRTSLKPGNYTAIVRGKNDSTGVAIVEVYKLSR